MGLAIFQKKGNTKKKRTRNISSEKMLGMAFVVSFVIHLVAIYAIPAVDLFSEGGGDAFNKMIEVDFIAEEFVEEESDPLGAEENQFLAAQPTPVEIASQVEEPLPVEEEPEMPSPPEVDRPLEDFTLLSRTFDQEPEFSVEHKRPTPAPPVRRTPEMPKMEKLPVKRESTPLDSPERQEPLPTQKPPVVPTQAEQPQPTPEERLQFPVAMPPLTTRSSADSPEDAPDKPLGFTSKRPAHPLSQETPLPDSTINGGAPTSKRRLVGLDAESIQDKNRFGIFAGEKFELPQMKDAVQEASTMPEGPETPVTEETERARSLEVNTQIEGPVRGRAIVYKPVPPQLGNIENEVALRLKFWVLPDGTIGEVIPLKRGDAQLERIAIAYLKKWQFEPLASNVPQQQIWGTIPIVFTAQ